MHSEVVVVIGAGGIGQAIARRWTVGFERSESLEPPESRKASKPAKPAWDLLKLDPKSPLAPHFLPQFHFYGGEQLPAATGACKAPCFIGEFALADPKDDEKARYRLALGWSARAKDRRSAWTRAVCDTIASAHGRSSCAECEQSIRARSSAREPSSSRAEA